MTAHNADMTEVEGGNNVAGTAFFAAYKALEEHTSDATGSARYNRQRAYDVAFDAAMDVLREVPLSERPEGLVKALDEVCALVRTEDRQTAINVLQERIHLHAGAALSDDKLTEVPSPSIWTDANEADRRLLGDEDEDPEPMTDGGLRMDEMCTVCGVPIEAGEDTCGCEEDLVTDGGEDLPECLNDGCANTSRQRSSYCSSECYNEHNGHTAMDLVDPDADPYTDGGRLMEDSEDTVDVTDRTEHLLPGDRIRVTYEDAFRGRDHIEEATVTEDPFQHRSTPDHSVDVEVEDEDGKGTYMARITPEGRIKGLDANTRRHDHHKGTVTEVLLTEAVVPAEDVDPRAAVVSFGQALTEDMEGVSLHMSEDAMEPDTYSLRLTTQTDFLPPSYMAALADHNIGVKYLGNTEDGSDHETATWLLMLPATHDLVQAGHYGAKHVDAADV